MRTEADSPVQFRVTRHEVSYTPGAAKRFENFVNTEPFPMPMSQRYNEMIEHLRAALSLRQWLIPNPWRTDPWGTFLRVNPEAMSVVRRVQDEHGYELSWNQCCNAVARLLE